MFENGGDGQTTTKVLATLNSTELASLAVDRRTDVTDAL
jgi:hypothetical protein